ncbi:MAG: hypothetical protein JWQ04_3385, partial [Pedosphaera sp.]|nr:hypothetical protein [Pedosphaera sp.]
MKRLLTLAAILATGCLATSSVMAQRPLGVDVSSYQGGI